MRRICEHDRRGAAAGRRVDAPRAVHDPAGASSSPPATSWSRSGGRPRTGRRAAALGKLRKPALADWALNVVAADHGDDVAAFLDAAGTVRDAQAAAIEGRDGPDIRAALRDLREHSGQVLGRAQEVLAGAGRDAAAEAGTVASRLTEIAANDEASAQLAAGVLGSAGLDHRRGVRRARARPDRRSPRRTGRREKSASPKTAVDGGVGDTNTRGAQAGTEPGDPSPRRARRRTSTRADAAVERPPPPSATPSVNSSRPATCSAPPSATGTSAARRLADAEDEVGAAEQALDDASR